LISAGTAGCISRTLTAPLERIKLEMQIGGVKSGNTLVVAQRVMQQEGIQGFWAGNGASLLRVFPVSGIACVLYHFFVDQLNYFFGGSPALNRTVGAGAAGIVATTAVYPLDVVRARLALQGSNGHHTYNGILDCGRKIIRTGGIFSLYRGLGVTILGCAPFLAIQQGIYDSLKFGLLDFGFQPGLRLYFGCGMIAGMGAQTFVFPMDLIRRKMQMSNLVLLKLLRRILMREGLSGFTTGLMPTILRTMPAVAIAVSIRDTLVHRFQNRQ